MKDILITAQRQRKELIIYLICLLVAIGLNIFSIIKYSTSWSELITQLPYVIIISLGIYVVTAVVRLLVYLIRIPFRKKN